MNIPDKQPTIRKGKFLREQVYKTLKGTILEGKIQPKKKAYRRKACQ